MSVWQLHLVTTPEPATSPTSSIVSFSILTFSAASTSRSRFSSLLYRGSQPPDTVCSIESCFGTSRTTCYTIVQQLASTCIAVRAVWYSMLHRKLRRQDCVYQQQDARRRSDPFVFGPRNSSLCIRSTPSLLVALHRFTLPRPLSAHRLLFFRQMVANRATFALRLASPCLCTRHRTSATPATATLEPRSFAATTAGSPLPRRQYAAGLPRIRTSLPLGSLARAARRRCPLALAVALRCRRHVTRRVACLARCRSVPIARS